MVVPTPDGELNPLVLAAARLAGVDEIYRVGGAQAVAALAYGTETIPPVDKIVGPGNAYVAAAKRQVFGRVGIDMIAGPSEVLVVADARQRSGLDRRRPARPGRARRGRAVDPDHRRRRPSPTRSSAAVEAQLAELPRARHRPRELARLRRDHRGARRSTRRRRWSTGSRPSIWSSRSPTPDALAARDPQRRRDLPRPPHAGGDRRLCRRPEPRAADGAHRALLLRPLRARFHEAHLDPEARRGRLPRSVPPRWRSPSRGPRRASRAPSPSGSTRRD